MLYKFGEAIRIGESDIQPVNNLLLDSDLEIEERMRKFAQELKAIAPMAKDFLYFSCVMMHAAEASLLDAKGEIKKLADGTPVTSKWEPVGENSVKWVCSDVGIKPYANSNRDIFPEYELKTASKKWIGRPLCLDHKSASVDMIRGVIVDTFYDDKRKRVIALCALDKKNYPDLAHKVASGYATDVSMGTAVGRAICTECHRVARVESEFCEHMRNKTCQGEINLDLNPLEISLVVSGADKDAKIKHIIAKDLSGINQAADSLNDYLNKKLALGYVEPGDLSDIKKDLQALINKLGKLIEESEKDNKEDESGAGTTWSGMTRSSPVIQREEPPVMNPPGGIPEPFPTYASSTSELQRAVLGLQVKLASIQTDYNKLSTMIKSEEIMGTEKKAYMQGTVEPNAGGVTYPPEPGEARARTEDKQMVGAPPFPAVGPVDGSYPGDEQAKKDLQRLASEEEERRITRMAALDEAKKKLAARKQAYFQGGGGPNEPKPGQKQYPVDPGEGEARKEDKQMVGAKPFPDVGDVTGLYGDDRKVKEMLARAALKAKFRKVSSPDGSIDKKNSRWDVYANDTLILTASVDQITRGNADALYDAIATQDYGKSLLNKIKTAGFHETRDALLKSAQAAPPPPPPPPAPPAGDMGVGAPGEAPADLEPPKDEGEDKVTGIIEDLSDLINDMDNKVSDLKEALKGVSAEAPELKDIKPAGESQFNEPLPQSVASLQSMRKTLNGMLGAGLQDAITDLSAHAKELSLTKDLYASKYASMNEAQREYLNKLAVAGVRDAKETVADSLRLMSAFVKYAYGTDNLVKRAQEQGRTDELVRPHDTEPTPGPGKVWEENMPKPDVCPFGQVPADGKCKIPDAQKVDDNNSEPTLAELEDMKNLISGDEAVAREGGIDVVHGKPVKDPGEDPGKVWREAMPAGSDCMPADDNAASPAIPMTPEQIAEVAGKGAKENIDLRTKEGRAMARTKLAQKGLTFSDMLTRAHPGAGPQCPNLDTKPTGDLAKIETLEETHKKMMDLANMPPKVRKQAEEIQRLVTAGDLSSADVDQLVAMGVDAEAVKYWKQYWGEAKDPESKEFAAKLTAEHAAQKKAEDEQNSKVRIKRAYDMAYQMRDAGIFETDQIDAQVDKIMKWNDEGFESMKNVISKHASLKKASVPSIGMLHSDQVILPSTTQEQTESGVNLREFLDQHFSSKKFRG
jgi:hypothetical protein